MGEEREVLAAHIYSQKRGLFADEGPAGREASGPFLLAAAERERRGRRQAADGSGEEERGRRLGEKGKLAEGEERGRPGWERRGKAEEGRC
jgi:hypothetical protein